ncbi:MAG: bifunctional 2-C-methyl-D-erythritol 4-phosphate cytidylyltransferase/2-C-methyl-D-erythritol 2,4-cyclodiphosphate synthase [Pseudomonadota bacterium]
MSVAALIVAAGRGTRAGQPGPKQYVPLSGEAVLTHTLRAMLAHPKITMVQVVIHADDLAPYTAAKVDDPRLLPPVTGGETRSASVKAGLNALKSHSPAYVLIHDAARPFVLLEMLDELIDVLESGAEGACPCLPVVNALWEGTDTLDTPRPRDGLLRAQTPQGFAFDAILAAHASTEGEFADDVGVARAAGMKVRRTKGYSQAFKITMPEDFARAEERIARMDVRTGCGYDVHAFEAGDHVTLCGIDIPHTAKLKGHSDADVAMHTITDALFGAIAEGDIGRWFPPSEPEWKGAASHIFLEKAVERVALRGGIITHIDCTIVCELPKIGPHAPAMTAKIAEICRIEPSRVSIKATTSERLGFTGREEGISAMATVTVMLK